MDIPIAAVTRHGPRQAIHIRTGTALQGQIHAAVRRQADLAGHLRIEGDGRVTFDSRHAAVAACGCLDDRQKRDMAVIRSTSGRYFVEPLVEQLTTRGHGPDELYVAAETMPGASLQGGALASLVLRQETRELVVSAV